MGDKSQRSTKLVVLADKSGKIRATIVVDPQGRADGPSRIGFIAGESDSVHEIDVSEDEARQITTMADYYVTVQGTETRLVRRDSGGFES
jgi:hypothetical protein